MSDFTKGQWSVYIIRCADQSLYTGISNDVTRRFTQHQDQTKRSAKYLRGKTPLTLVYQELAGTRSDASKREWQLKQMCKASKEKLIARHAINTTAEHR